MTTTITTPIGVTLKNLIVNKRLTKDDFIEKLNVFYTYNQITEDEYQELMLLVTTTFAPTPTDAKTTDTTTKDDSKTTTEKPVDTTKEDTKTTN